MFRLLLYFSLELFFLFLAKLTARDELLKNMEMKDELDFSQLVGRTHSLQSLCT